MVLLRYLWTVICAVLITTGAVSGEDVKKAVGDTVIFRPDKFIPLVTSIIWKQKNTAGTVVKAIEWDEGEILIPNPRFRDITKVDEKTGQINITNLKVEHSGVYTIDINSKEQEQRFTLTVMERVPKPEIKTQKIKDNTDVVYLNCEYSETIIWKNSAGETLTGSPITPKGESITVKKTGNPETFYTCTLDNGASKETSDPVYERDLFEDESKSGSGLIVGIVILIIIIIACILIFLYIRNEKFKERVNGCCTCFGGPKDKGPKLTGVKPNSESEPLNENAKVGGQQEANNVKEGELENTPAETADDAELEEVKTNPENENLNKDDKISEPKAAA
ncbi:SLAM family member 9-like [Megalobrama amblycephala]|uniref:SLAM family member 9-like n=1 Tax=Megalobrama amblycephala TaxID=75352 RepID=UPI0020145C16|nr:SLAM family member 9-like [Megalobrama amblycephala]